MRGDVSLPLGILGIPWGYISGVLLLGDRGPRGFSINLFDARPDWSQREIDEADCVPFGTYASRRQIVCYSAPLHLSGGDSKRNVSAMVRMMSLVGLSDESEVLRFNARPAQVYADCEIILRVAPQASVNGLLLMAGEVIS
jgi:hypothetical protein